MSKRKERKRDRSYIYSGFNDLKVGDRKANVFGLVVTYEPPTLINEGNYSCTIKLIDESETELNCIMSSSKIENLPSSSSPGDVLCLRRVAVERCGMELTIKAQVHTTWMLFRKDESFEPTSCFSDLIPDFTERTRLVQLSTWDSHRGLNDRANVPLQLNDSKTKPTAPVSMDVDPPSTSCPAPVISSDAPSDSPSHGNHSGISPCQPSSSILPFPSARVVHVSQRVSQPTKTRYYGTPLTQISSQVVGNKEAGVAGILKYFKPPSASRGNDYFTALCLIDDSNKNPSSISCVLFNPYKHKLPIVCSPGETVMLKGLIINDFQGGLQGRGHESCLVGVFPGDLSNPVPDKIGDWYVMKDSEKTKIKQLKSWAAKENPLLLNSKLEELTCSNYCTNVCLVIAVSVDSRGAMVLTVSDGTTPTSVLAVKSSLTTISNDPVLWDTYKGLTSTIIVSTTIKPQVAAGDFVQLVNLSMRKSDRSAASTELAVELVIQDHPLYQGSVHVLPSNSPIVAKFKSILSTPKRSQLSQNTVSTQHPLLSTVVNCSNIRQATLMEIQGSAVGTVHLAEVQVMGVGKGLCNKLEDMCQLRCGGCKSLYVTPQPHVPDYDQLLTAGDICVCCNSEEMLEPNMLEFMYAFSLLVADHTTQLEVVISGKEGEKFFSQVKLSPTNLYVDVNARHSLMGLLFGMTGGSDPFNYVSTEPRQPYPSLKCCISIFLSPTGNHRYRVINTTLCNS